MNKKICSRCNIEYPASTEYFYRDKNGLYGLRSICKMCQKNIEKKTKRKLRNQNLNIIKIIRKRFKNIKEYIV